MSVPTPIAGLLRRAERRWKGVHSLRQLLLVLALLAGVLLALCLLDNAVALPWPLRRGAFLLLLVAAAALLGWRLLRPLFQRTPDEALALRIERANPGLRNLLVNAVLLGERSADEPMVQVLVDQAAARAPRTDARRVAPWARLQRLCLWSAALVVAWGLYLTAFPAHAASAWERLYLSDDEAPPLSALHLEVRPGDCELLAGTDLRVEAHVVRGPLPAGATLHLERETGASAYPMEFDGAGFRYAVPGLREPLRYHVTAGDARTKSFAVTIAEPPAPEHIAVNYTYPEYSRLPPQRGVRIQGPLNALQGTRARVFFTFNRALRSARFSVDGADPFPMRPEGDPRRWSFETAIARSGRYTVTLEDLAGRLDRGDLSYAILAREDLPPSVRIPLPGRDVFCTADTRLAIEIAARDDVGLGAVELRVGTEEDERTAVSWPAAGPSGHFDAALTPGELGCAVGDVVHYYAVARDLKGTSARSRVFTVTVRTPEDENRRLAAGLLSLLERVRRILELQVGARERNEALLARVAGLRRRPWREATAELAGAQEEIRELSLGVLADWNDPVLLRAPARVLLERVSAREMVAVVRSFLEASGSARPAAQPLQRAAGQQRVIEKILREVIASGEALAALLREKGAAEALKRSSQRLRRSKVHFRPAEHRRGL